VTRFLFGFGIAVALSAASLSGSAHAADEDAGKVEYKGKAPANLDTLAEHRAIANYTGAPFRRCLGRTARCPDRCGNSGEFATFDIVDYLHYTTPGKYGDKKQKNYRVQISDFQRKPRGPKELNKAISSLKPGDLVLLEWKHLYGETQPGVKSPVRPLLHLRRITAEEAARLKKAARGA